MYLLYYSGNATTAAADQCQNGLKWLPLPAR